MSRSLWRYQLRQMTSLPRRKLASWSVDAIAKWPTDQLMAVAAYGLRAGGQHHPGLAGWLPTMWGPLHRSRGPLGAGSTQCMAASSRFGG